MVRKGFAARQFRKQSKVARNIKNRGGRVSGGVKYGASGLPGSSLKKKRK